MKDSNVRICKRCGEYYCIFSWNSGRKRVSCTDEDGEANCVNHELNSHGCPFINADPKPKKGICQKCLKRKKK